MKQKWYPTPPKKQTLSVSYGNKILSMCANTFYFWLNFFST